MDRRHLLIGAAIGAVFVAVALALAPALSGRSGSRRCPCMTASASRPTGRIPSTRSPAATWSPGRSTDSAGAPGSQCSCPNATPQRVSKAASLQFSPSISGDRVVWQDKRNGNWDIYLANLSTGEETPICTDPSKQAHPVISGDVVVWTDERNGDPDIYCYDLSNRTERAICVQPQTQYNPDVDGDVVVWEDYRQGYETAGDIYAYLPLDRRGARDL